jgi:hypothetical protein
MPKIAKILCVGDNTLDTDTQCRQYAEEYQVEYRGLLLSDDIDDGCYHTSIEDTSITFIKDIYDKFHKVVFLKQNNIITDILANTYSLSADSRKELLESEILFVGCSHTAGIGHSTQDTVYTNQFAKMLNLTPRVSGNPGRGNYLIEDILSTYNLSGTKVIVQFTDVFRIRYFSSKENKVIHKMGYEFTQNELELFDDQRQKYEYLRMVDRVVSRLRDCDSQFLFFQLAREMGLQEEIDLYQSQYREFCYMADIGVDKAEDERHFGINSHSLIAKNIYQKWLKLYA